MQISDLVGHYNNSTQQTEGLSQAKGVERLVSSLRDMSAGNIFEGTVNSMKNGQVVLGLSNGHTVTARMDGNVPITVGQSLFFQVKSNDGVQIAIRPFTIAGNSINLTLMDALKAAGLSVDAKNLSMVNTMMEQQMSIDRNSLAQMARIVQNNSEINVRTLVQMQKLNIPITPEFASQFENYMDDKQAIGKALNDFMTQLPTALLNEQLLLGDLKQMSGQILSILTEGLPEIPQQDISLQETPPTVTNQDIAPTTAQLADNNNIANVQGTDNSNIVNMQPADNSNIVNPQLTDMQNEQVLQTAVAENVYPEHTLGNLLNQEEMLNLKKQLLAVFGDSLNAQEFVETHFHAKQGAVFVLHELQEQLTGSNVSDKNVLLKLFSGKEFQALVKSAMEQQWMIRPQDLESGDKISKLYEHLEHQLSRIEKVVKATGQEAQNVTQLAAEIRSNIEFMNQINQTYTYVQIPLKMSGQNASGELYVYTNKKNLTEGNDELTAFLHLDMDNLGSTDVSLRLQGKDISTKFYFDNDESFALVQQHLPILEEKLAQKGYRCNLSVVNEGKKVNFVEDFLKKDQPSTGMLHRYSFDMRA